MAAWSHLESAGTVAENTSKRSTHSPWPLHHATTLPDQKPTAGADTGKLHKPLPVNASPRSGMSDNHRIESDRKHMAAMTPPKSEALPMQGLWLPHSHDPHSLAHRGHAENEGKQHHSSSGKQDSELARREKEMAMYAQAYRAKESELEYRKSTKRDMDQKHKTDGPSEKSPLGLAMFHPLMHHRVLPSGYFTSLSQSVVNEPIRHNGVKGSRAHTASVMSPPLRETGVDRTKGGVVMAPSVQSLAGNSNSGNNSKALSRPPPLIKHQPELQEVNRDKMSDRLMPSSGHSVITGSRKQPLDALSSMSASPLPPPLLKPVPPPPLAQQQSCRMMDRGEAPACLSHVQANSERFEAPGLRAPSPLKVASPQQLQAAMMQPLELQRSRGIPGENGPPSHQLSNGLKGNPEGGFRDSTGGSYLDELRAIGDMKKVHDAQMYDSKNTSRIVAAPASVIVHSKSASSTLLAARVEPSNPKQHGSIVHGTSHNMFIQSLSPPNVPLLTPSVISIPDKYSEKAVSSHAPDTSLNLSCSDLRTVTTVSNSAVSKESTVVNMTTSLNTSWSSSVCPPSSKSPAYSTAQILPGKPAANLVSSCTTQTITISQSVVASVAPKAAPYQSKKQKALQSSTHAQPSNPASNGNDSDTASVKSDVSSSSSKGSMEVSANPVSSGNPNGGGSGLHTKLKKAWLTRHSKEDHMVSSDKVDPSARPTDKLPASESPSLQPIQVASIKEVDEDQRQEMVKVERKLKKSKEDAAENRRVKRQKKDLEEQGRVKRGKTDERRASSGKEEKKESKQAAASREDVKEEKRGKRTKEDPKDDDKSKRGKKEHQEEKRGKQAKDDSGKNRRAKPERKDLRQERRTKRAAKRALESEGSESDDSEGPESRAERRAKRLPKPTYKKKENDMQKKKPQNDDEADREKEETKEEGKELGSADEVESEKETAAGQEKESVKEVTKPLPMESDKKEEEPEKQEDEKKNGVFNAGKLEEKPKLKLDDEELPESVLKDWRKVKRLKQTGETFLQDGACTEITPSLQKCRECRMVRYRKGQEVHSAVFCRFYHFRRLSFNKNGALRIYGFSAPNDCTADDLSLWVPGGTGAPALRAEGGIESARYILSHVGPQFCRMVQAEKDAKARIPQDAKVAWKRAVRGVREMCDACEATLFNVHWVCPKCGFVVCPECYTSRREKRDTENEGKKETFSWIKCVKGQVHDPKNLIPTQIIPGTALYDLGELMHATHERLGMASNCPCFGDVQSKPFHKLLNTNGVSQVLHDLIASTLKNGINIVEPKQEVSVNSPAKDTKGEVQDLKEFHNNNGNDNKCTETQKHSPSDAGKSQSESQTALHWLADLATQKAKEEKKGTFPFQQLLADVMPMKADQNPVVVLESILSPASSLAPRKGIKGEQRSPVVLLETFSSTSVPPVISSASGASSSSLRGSGGSGGTLEHGSSSSTLRDLLTTTAGKLRIISTDGGMAFAPVMPLMSHTDRSSRSMPNLLDDIIASVVENKIPSGWPKTMPAASRVSEALARHEMQEPGDGKLPKREELHGTVKSEGFSHPATIADMAQSVKNEPLGELQRHLKTDPKADKQLKTDAGQPNVTSGESSRSQVKCEQLDEALGHAPMKVDGVATWKVPHGWLCGGCILHLYNPTEPNNWRAFRECWTWGQPVVVSRVHEYLRQEIWNPESLARDICKQETHLVDCNTLAAPSNTILKDFWEGFQDNSVRPKNESGEPMVLKLKEWPTGDDFRDLLPDRFEDLTRNVPLAEYTTREGRLNLASHPPDFFVRPELGPKLHVAYGLLKEGDIAFGTRGIHSDLADTINILVHVEEAAGTTNSREVLQKALEVGEADETMKLRFSEAGQKAGALWHIFSAGDASKVREFLSKVAAEKEEEEEPVEGDVAPTPSIYLDAELRRRLQQEQGVRPVALVQCLGDALLIPAGSLYQVQNLYNCIAVSDDFVSPENVQHCLRLTHELRQWPDGSHEDKLQVKNIIYHVVKNMVGILSARELKNDSQPTAC